ncbi:hypothetical protein DPMN_161803 [Dreissena polymorpha]|uniref:Uncharacterized protein n=1 Tax=Dreissena polymorpha TaxID=45954 RepID=A0A9D4ER35_DREPO|nr:hypothetical protein DPMN_161803 [Dreissena polymorpha]
MVVGGQCQYSRRVRHGRRVRITTKGIPDMVAESRYPINGCTRHGSRESVSLQWVCQAW